MSMNFKIKEQKTINYNQAKEAYQQGIKGKKLRRMFNLGTSQYMALLKDFRAEGLPVKTTSNKPKREIKKYYKHLCKGITYWSVSKIKNGETHYFGHYKTQAEAEARVKELKENNWEGLL